MDLLTFIQNWGAEIFLTLTTTGALWLCKRFYSKNKKLEEY
jgi:hypothetical protein